MKSQVDSLRNVVREMQTRIEVLEEETTNLKLEVLKLQHEPPCESDDEDRELTRVKERTLQTPSAVINNDLLPHGNDRPRNEASVPPPSTHTSPPVPEPRPANLGVTSSNASVQQGIKGTAQDSTMAIASTPPPGSTCDVYVGRLKSKTTTEEVKLHLIRKVGFLSEEIMGITQLRKQDFASFNVTFKDRDTAEKVFRPDSLSCEVFQSTKETTTQTTPRGQFSQANRP